MSILSDLANKAAKSLGAEALLPIVLDSLVSEGRKGGRQAVERMATIPQSALLRVSPKASLIKVELARRALATAAADLVDALAANEVGK